MTLTLVVLAAGMGSRYGGLKQLDPVGPAGETVLDYAVFDAQRSGFGRVVFVIRKEFEEAFHSQVGARYAGRLEVDYAFQSVDDLPTGFGRPAEREKPWGTGHAVWCAREKLRDGPFAVINADDFYGRDAFGRLAGFLGGGAEAETRGRAAGCMVGFRLAQTLSEHGAVSRGVCDVGPDGRLRSVVERTAITRGGDGRIRSEDTTGGGLGGDEIVSMNCWGLPPEVLPGLERELVAFLERRREEAKAEFYLPAAVANLIAKGALEVAVLPTEGAWFGVTYREDKPMVQAALRRLVDAGVYRPGLWERA